MLEKKEREQHRDVLRVVADLATSQAGVPRIEHSSEDTFRPSPTD